HRRLFGHTFTRPVACHCTCRAVLIGPTGQLIDTPKRSADKAVRPDEHNPASIAHEGQPTSSLPIGVHSSSALQRWTPAAPLRTRYSAFVGRISMSTCPTDSSGPSGA